MVTNQSIHTEGADLVFDVQGSGPALLLIPGAGGTGAVYDQIVPLLTDEYTVIIYDRRGNARSSGDTNTDLDMAQQARDVVAVLKAAGQETAIVFGNSGGANIALQVAADYPGHVTLLLAHEPPAVGLLPDAHQQLAFMDRVYDTFVTAGVPAAMKLFASSLTGFTGPVAGGLGQGKDVPFFLGKEYRPITRFIPDLERIRRANVATILLVGQQSGEASYARTVPIIAQQLTCPMVTVPGNHLAFLIDPQPFVDALREILAKQLTNHD